MLRLRSTIAALVAVATAMSLTSVAWAADTTAEAETMSVSPASAGRVVSDSTASGGSAMQMRSNSVLSVTGTVPASTTIVVIAKAVNCFGPPTMSILVDEQSVYTTSVKTTTWTTYSVTTDIPAGAHEFSVAFSNDFNLFCDRSLYVDKMSIVGGVTEPPPTGTCTQPPPSSTQPFADEFDGSAGTPPDPQTWSYQVAGGNLQMNTNYPRNASLDGNGNLAITVIKERIYVWGYGWRDYTSARLHTMDKLEICYGTLRTRMKIPNGKGLKPAFFLLGHDITNVGWPAAGEIDIIDVADRLGGSGIHGTGFSKATRAPFDVTGEWHEFWMQWEPDKIVTGVDAQEIATYTPASLPQGASWPFNDNPMFMNVGISVGGEGGPPDSTTQFPATMLVDWVRYTPPDG